MQLLVQFDQAAPFTHENREKLLELVEKHTCPPKSMTGPQQSHYLQYYMLWQMAEIPEDQLRPLFGKAAWKVAEEANETRGADEKQLRKTRPCAR